MNRRRVRWLKCLRYHVARWRTRASFRFEGLDFQVAPGVLNPTLFRASFFFARQALVQAPAAPADVLELGCGCGLTAIALAARGHRVTAVDVDPSAVENTRANAARNGIALAAIPSDWDKGLSARFDYVVSNPPFLRTRTPVLESALFAGEGLEHLAAMAASVRRCLKPAGRALIVTSSATGRDAVSAIFATNGFETLRTEHVRDWDEHLFADLLTQNPPAFAIPEPKLPLSR